MKLKRILRNAVAGVLIAAVPVSTAIAATRPSAAVPVAGSTAVAAQVYDDRDDRRAGIAWPAVAVIAAALLVAIWIIIDDDDEGEGALSRA